MRRGASLPMPTTRETLEHAFTGEARANRLYTAWSRKADQEGFPVIARLFRAVAESETVHALEQLRALDGVRTTAENVAAAIAGGQEVVDGGSTVSDEPGTRRKLRRAATIDALHAELFLLAQAALAAGRDLDDVDIYLCPCCGHLELVRPVAPCPTCGLPAERHSLVS